MSVPLPPALEDLEKELSKLKAHGLYRTIRRLEQVRGVRAVLDSKGVLLFCSNDYLGLSQDARVLASMKQAADSFGVGSGAARLISGSSDRHMALEIKIAQLKKKEAALLFTAGYLANLGVLTALAGPGDLIVMDKLCHASIIDGARLSGAQVRTFPHLSTQRAEAILAQNRGARRTLLVSDSVFSMDGDLCDLTRLVELKKKFGCWLVIDDAHGTGVFGRTGGGVAEDLNLEDEIDVIVGTLSKAVGVIGGFAAASKIMIDYLINHARPFIFATSLPPAICAAAGTALDVIREDADRRDRLWAHAKTVYQGFQSAGFQLGPFASPIIPILIGDEKKALEISQKFLNAGFLVPAIRTPAVAKGKARLRLTVSAAHTVEEIDGLLCAARKIRLLQ